MSEKVIKMSLTAETQDKQLEIESEAVKALASELHENWRKTRLKEDGSFEPRVKATKDEAWIVEHGTDQVDIANTKYEGLPSDWKAENKAASEVIVGIMIERNGQINLDDPAQRSEIGTVIHDAWLNRNDWARGGELDVPFDQLPPEEQAKDIDQLIIAQQIFSF